MYCDHAMDINLAETLAPMERRSNRLTPAEGNAYRRRLFALGLTQNAAAKKIRVKSGPFSTWIRGGYTSARNRKKLDALLAREESKQSVPAVARPRAAAVS